VAALFDRRVGERVAGKLLLARQLEPMLAFVPEKAKKLLFSKSI
jgi:hypothetical protein